MTFTFRKYSFPEMSRMIPFLDLSFCVFVLILNRNEKKCSDRLKKCQNFVSFFIILEKSKEYLEKKKNA